MVLLTSSLLQDPCLLGSLEDGLNALLNIEVWNKALQLYCTLIIFYGPWSKFYTIS